MKFTKMHGLGNDYIYVNGFKWYRMGYGSALAYVLLAITLVITLVQFAAQRRWVHYD